MNPRRLDWLRALGTEPDDFRCGFVRFLLCISNSFSLPLSILPLSAEGG